MYSYEDRVRAVKRCIELGERTAATIQQLGYLRISAIVDARFSLIVDGETASSRVRRGGAQAPGVNVPRPSTISLKRCCSRVVSRTVLGLY